MAVPTTLATMMRDVDGGAILVKWFVADMGALFRFSSAPIATNRGPGATIDPRNRRLPQLLAAATIWSSKSRWWADARAAGVALAVNWPSTIASVVAICLAHFTQDRYRVLA
jgi:hypothetical protein